jgi:MFS family permease
MPNPYKEIFSAPGTKNFTAAGLLARLPLPMTHMGILTMLSELRGQYALAGAVAGTFTLSTALIGPQVSRVVDRLGQGRVLLPATGISVAALGALLLCAYYDAPAWTLFLFALLAGFMPSMGAMVRARWTELYRGTPRLGTAYSFEAVIDELTYVISPALAVVLSTTLFPEAAPLLAMLLLAGGVLLFVPQKLTEPPVQPQTADGGGSVIRSAPVLVLALSLLSLGAIPGTIDTMALAFAEDLGQKSATGIVFTMYAIGSGLSGLAFGARMPRLPLPRLLVLAAAGTALTTVPLLFVHNLVTLSAVVFFAGLFFAPTLIVIMTMVERIVPATKLTEGMTWMIAGLSVGLALGAALAGQLVDAFGTMAGFSTAVAAGVLALLVSLLGYRLLKSRTAPAATPPSTQETDTERDDDRRPARQG